MIRAIASLVLAAVVAACSVDAGASGSAGLPTQAPASIVDQTQLPSPTSAPEPTAVPVLDVSSALYVAWDTGFATSAASFYAIAQVVLPVRNVGSGWLRLRPSESHYTITTSDGRVLATAAFDSTYPSDLAPGQIGYLTAEAILNNEKAASIGAVTGDATSEDIARTDAVVMTIAKVKTSYSAYYKAVITSGTVTNQSSKRVNGFDVAALYFDAQGAFLGLSSLNPGVLRARATATFETIPITHGLLLAKIARTVAVPGCYCPNQ